MALPSMGVRAGAPAAQGGARPRPLRGPLLDRPAPARADDHGRVRVPPAPAARGAGKKRSRLTGTAAPADPARGAAHARRAALARLDPLPALRLPARPALAR